MNEHRLTVLEQQFKVMQTEMNEVLTSMQQAMDLLMKSNVKALQSLQFQIEELKKETSPPARDPKQAVEL